MTGLSPLLIGIAFGFVLERSGLGDPRKLAAQFTFADFTVLKVMLTAIVTAGVGLFWLGWAGVVDPGSVYLPSTNLLPQVVGGVIFGAGFALGGYCPGTSCVAAAAGRGDAVMLIGGMFAGTVAFAEAFPLIEPFYSATPLGPVTWYGEAGIPHGLALAGLLAAALGAFVAVQRVERRAPRARTIALLAAGALLVAAPTAAVGPGKREAPQPAAGVAVPAESTPAGADSTATGPASGAPPAARGWRSAGGCGPP